MRLVLGFASGLLFGLGLILAGMSNPAKVLNFLDIVGAFDPSLAFVMGGAALTTFIGYRLVWRRGQPLLMSDFQIPTRKDIDRDLLTGAALFGIGWGIGGFCPGPAWTALPLATPGILAFLPSMLAGMALALFVKGRRLRMA
ncbi:hypothetical protein SAMN06297251_12364 [Fulvimarina manganoxydans]|uniref:Sulphur transport domain-containing protein n=1 Tax=Fulvimarina manganoxydans TaxID=937218 RepID=A0A1W2EBH2_9HYPH|nr:DUF6691 family protein [Fulvimarina manganoxydans]MEE2950899.1 DUF6691 family protein [Pseudomonadota bacterium]SMD07104.1 hypothetical protein SAMN06297251_12364 [Fulvimarina manganoxydans]